MPAMVPWWRNTPLTCERWASARIRRNTSTVNSSASGSGPREAMPGTSEGSRTTYAASRFLVPASVMSRPVWSSSTTRRASDVVDERPLECLQRRVEGLERAERGDVDLGDGASGEPAPQVQGQRLHLGQLRHAGE